jgi:hypothetical protein
VNWSLTEVPPVAVTGVFTCCCAADDDEYTVFVLVSAATELAPDATTTVEPCDGDEPPNV